MALELIRVKVPATFNPANKTHVGHMIERVSQEKGPGWEVQSYDAPAQQLTLSRTSALTEVAAAGSTQDSFEVSLGLDVKASEGERTAQRLEADNPGFYLTEFRPHVKRARLTRMNEAEVRCRDAISGVIGVPRWEVQVKQRRDKGFAFEVSPRYSPGKHDLALQEVAEVVVGRPGWYVKIDPKTLKGDIIPAEQPTFEPVYHYDFSSLPMADKVPDKDLFKIPLGVALGGNGQPNRPFEMDLSDSVGALIVGLAGAGKSVSTQAILFSALAKGWDIALINTVDKATDFIWAKPFVADHLWGCDSVAQAVAVAKLVAERGEHMGRLLTEHRVSKWQDLPAGVRRENPPLLLVADELAALLTADPLPSGLSKEMKELPEFLQMQQDLLESKLLATALSKIPAVYRAAGIRVVYLTQQPNERYGFSTKLKGNLPHRVMLGVSPSQAEKGHAFRTPEKVPDVPTNIAQDNTVARGVGLAHLDGQEPVVFKGYFAPLDTYVAEAKRRRFATTSRPEPTDGQIARLVPRLDGETDGGELPQQGFGLGPRVYEAWELDADGRPLQGYELANATRAEATRLAKQAAG